MVQAFSSAKLDLQKLYIPDAIDVEGGIGVGIAAITNGLVAVIEAYPGMAIGDTVSIFWGETDYPVLDKTVSPAELDETLYLSVPEERIHAGWATVFYRLKRISGGEVDSPELQVLVKLDQPGGIDPDPSTPENENLVAPNLPAHIIESGVVSKDDAAQGIDVTIAPYENMTIRDMVHLSWGGVFVDYRIKQADVDKSFSIHVDEKTILEAGDSDATIVQYMIRDEVLNRSKYSRKTRIRVEASGSLLAPPLIPQADENGVIDLVDLKGQDVEVQVYALAALSFAIGDTIEMNWRGFSAEGVEILHTGSATVTALNRLITIMVPYAKVEAIALGSAYVSYKLKKKDGKVLNSQRATVSINGEIIQLPAPVVDEAQGSILPSDAQKATVRIAAYQGMAAGDDVTLVWQGQKANGESYLRLDEFPVSGSMVGREMVRSFKREDIAVLAGGSVEVYYEILVGGRKSLTRAQLTSERLELKVTAAVAQLPAPSVAEASNGVLDPEDAENGATVAVAAYSNMAVGDTVRLYWTGSATNGSTTDYIPVKAATVGKTVKFTVPLEYVQANLGGVVNVHYQVDRKGGGTEQSLTLSLRIQQADASQLAAPEVDEANSGALSPDIPHATVRIKPYPFMNAGDDITLMWQGQKANGENYLHKDEFPVSGNMVGKEIARIIDGSHIKVLAGGKVKVLYQVERGDGRLEESLALALGIGNNSSQPLPAPGIDEAKGDRLDPDDVTNGATVRIEATAQLREGDKVTLRWIGTPGEGSYSSSKTITAIMAGKDLTFTVPHTTVIANKDRSITLRYEVQRAATGETIQSSEADYDIRHQIGAERPYVMGARYSRSPHWKRYMKPRRLTALHPKTRVPMLVEWSYVGDSDFVSGTSFRDSQPWRVLKVSSTTDDVYINPANIAGSGDTIWDKASTSAMTARLDNGRVLSWGSKAYGGTLPATIATLNDIVEVVGTSSSFAARRANGHVVAWGGANYGASVPTDIAQLSNVAEIAANWYTFAVRLEDGSVRAWGNTKYGGSVPSVIAGLRDIVEISSSQGAFAARRANGHVVTWGDSAYGGNVPNNIATRDDIVEVIGSTKAFAARCSDGTVVAWGSADYGGSLPGTIASFNDIVEVTSNQSAFAALRSNGQVVTWGYAGYGGQLPSEIAALNDIVEVSGSYYAFAARRSDGSVVAWGRNDRGGAVPSNIMTLTDIVQVVGTSGAFAALRSNGYVVAWGLTNPDRGGNAPNIGAGHRAIYSSTQSFASLNDMKALHTWGRGDQGGDSSAVSSQIYKNISYEASPASRARYRQIEETEQMRRGLREHERKSIPLHADPIVDRSVDGTICVKFEKHNPVVTVSIVTDGCRT